MNRTIKFDHPQSWSNGFPPNPVIQNHSMKQVYETIDIIKEYETNVLIQGESGTGKSMLARRIISLSPRASEPFIEVNCGSLNDQLLESELFGHVKGAFTGAVKSRQGKIEAANQGTLFLDDINSASLAMQTKLLNVIENRSIQRVGDNETIHVGCRFICASNQNISSAVNAKRFREDLYYRIAVINLELPPLRERPDEILPLIDFYIGVFNKKYEKNFKGLTQKDRQLALNYSWPGNVRELKNAVERSFVLSSGKWVKLNLINRDRCLEPNAAVDRDDLSLKQAVMRYEKRYIKKVLDENEWKIDQASIQLKIGRSTLFNKIKKYCIQK